VIGLRPYVAIESCASTAGGWTASGSARNPGRVPTAYRITIFFTSSQATVEGFGDTIASIPAGKSAHWSVTSKIPAPDPHSQCVLRGVGPA
jgi:hypothetical protein